MNYDDGTLIHPYKLNSFHMTLETGNWQTLISQWSNADMVLNIKGFVGKRRKNKNKEFWNYVLILLFYWKEKEKEKQKKSSRNLYKKKEKK